MTATQVAGVMLIAVPVAFNVEFALLASRFDYPDILRRPTDEILSRFREGGSGLVLLWWSFALTAVVFAPLVVLVAWSLAGANGALLLVGGTIGVLAGLVQFLGLMRWPFLVPYLAREAASASPERRAAVEVVFQASHRYLGVAVGEHLGYGLTGAWSVLTGAAVVQSTVAPAWLGVVGIVCGALLLVCSAEFLGKYEPMGWTLAGRITPIAYVAWSLWLAATGVALLA